MSFILNRLRDIFPGNCMQAIVMYGLMVHMILCTRYAVSERSPKHRVMRSMMARTPNRKLKKASGDLFRHLTGQPLRTLLIRAGFPYHKSPHAFQWLWVFILVPFLEEDSLNELSHTYGKPLRKLYGILLRYPHAFERLMQLLAEPLFSKNSMNGLGAMPVIKAAIARR